MPSGRASRVESTADSRMMKARACFFAKVANRETLDRVEFYAQDIQILRDLGFDVRIATSVRQIRSADLFFVWWWTWAFFPVLAARTLRKPAVITGVFDAWTWDSRPGWHQAMMRFALRQAHANVFISQMETTQVPQNFFTNNPKYVPLSVDSSVYAPNGREREDVVLSVGLMKGDNAIRKGMPDVLRAAALMKDSHPHVRFVIAGEKGSYFPEMQRLASHLGVASMVEFPGAISREEKIRWMQRCKVYVQPSRFEGFGLAILEAMSCGASIVSSPVGAVPEVVGDTGKLVRGSSAEEIASAIIGFLDSPQMRGEMGHRARLRAESLFSYSRRKQEMQNVLNEL